MTKKRFRDVLLIEDNLGDVGLLRGMFMEQTPNNTVLTHVDCMAAAEKHLATQPTDMILLDLGLPDAQGLEAVRRAHAAAPGIPLVVLTGFDDDSLAVQALQQGAQDYLIKADLDARGLLRTLRYATERKAMEDALFAEMGRTQVTLNSLQKEVARRVQAEEVTRESEHQLAQAQKMEALGQLTGGIAHDFNNLLTVIKINAEDVLEDAATPSTHRDQISMALQAANRGGDLVRQLLTVARKQQLQPEVISMETVLDPLAKMLRRTLQENITIDIRKAADLCPVHVDPGSLENVILNLSINARDAMPDGGTLTIEVENAVLDEAHAASGPGVQPGPYVLIAVSDTGTGMPKDVIDRAFEPFFTTKEVGKGTGLGLSMVFGFVKQSGGHATIYSEVGYGTTIKIYLPVATIAPSTVEATLVEAAADVSASATGNILLVEDDDLVSRSVSHKLKRLGYTITVASTPAESIAFLETMPPFDLVFTDIIMPGPMTGADLAREVQRRWPATKILATSGYAESTLLGKVTIPEGVRLLAKPYSNAEFVRTIRQALSG
jgi:signal transduction histidine kinase